MSRGCERSQTEVPVDTDQRLLLLRIWLPHNLMSGQHHLPRMYLKAWAEDNKVAFRRRGTPVANITAIKNVASVNGLYTDEAEKLFGNTESAAAPTIKRLGSGATDLSDSDRRVLAPFMVDLMARQIYMAMFMGRRTPPVDATGRP